MDILVRADETEALLASGNAERSTAKTDNRFRGELDRLERLQVGQTALFVIDNSGNTVSHNNRFLDLWRIPASGAERKAGKALTGFLLDQLQARGSPSKNRVINTAALKMGAPVLSSVRTVGSLSDIDGHRKSARASLGASGASAR